MIQIISDRNASRQGYDTHVGDGGVKLSGGQKQRIAIARSIVKRPRIIIFDEATSALDTKSEKIVLEALERASRNRTTITVAHRLSTIRKADHIIVLQNGRVAEEGTHQSLIEKEGGAYSALVRAQSLSLLRSDKTPPRKVELKPPTTSVAYEDVASSDMEKSSTDCNEVVDTNRVSSDNSIARLPSEQSALQSRGVLCSFGRLLYEQRAEWLSYTGFIISSMAVATGTPIQAWLFAKVLGVFLLTDSAELQKDSDFWGIMWLVLAAGVGVSYLCEGWVGLRVQYFMSATYKIQYLADMLRQKIAFFDEDKNSHGALTSRISRDAKELEEMLGLNLAMLLSGVFIVVGCIAISLTFGWKLALVATFITMPIMLFSGYWKYRHEVQFEKMSSAVFTESAVFATEAIGAIRTVSALTMESAINGRYQQLLDDHVAAALRKAQSTSLLYGFVDSASLGCQALVFWYGGKLLSAGEYTLEAFFVCFMAIIQGAEAASQALSVAPNAAQARAAANRILNLRESAEADRDGTEISGMIPKDAGPLIELRNVRFKYPTRDIPVFEGISLSIEKGQHVAFVGPSGCGKTTIISLLERFYDLAPGQGSILYKGVNINDLGIHEYRQCLSLVSQEPTMFRGTVRDNILFGIPESCSISDARIQEVCQLASIHDFIVSLPDGYDTEVGHKGISLSGGQKQRVAIARALIREPTILLLDEATSALDSESEKIVQDALDKARTGRTTIAVAHRLSTIQNADVIFVFDNGRVVEKGTHHELLSNQGVYWEMVSLSTCMLIAYSNEILSSA